MSENSVTPMGILITYKVNDSGTIRQISSLVEELLVTEPGAPINILMKPNRGSKRDLSPVRKNNLGFIDQTRLPTTTEELIEFDAVCKHNKKLTRELLQKTTPSSRGERRSKRISQKKKK
jgi:hypothetical protein